MPGAEDDPVVRSHIAHGILERGHVGDVVGVARRRVAGEAVVGPINSLVMCNTLDVKILRYIELQKASPFTKKFDVFLQGAMLLLGQLFHRLGPRSEAQRLLLELSVFDFEKPSKSHQRALRKLEKLSKLVHRKRRGDVTLVAFDSQQLGHVQISLRREFFN